MAKMIRSHGRTLAAQGIGIQAVVKVGEEFFSCSINDMSNTGAGLSLDNPIELPAKFELRFARNTRNCSLVWQETGNAGVLFEADPGQSEQSNPKAYAGADASAPQPWLKSKAGPPISGVIAGDLDREVF
jgi:hypothetical protein